MRFNELGKRIKENYEFQTTQRKLMHGLPVYCRIDQRAGHTFCRGLKKPWSLEYVETMQEVTKFLIEETHAQLGYVQSDEISLAWLDVDKAPFDGKLHKLESVLASLATSKFVNYIYKKYSEIFSSEITDDESIKSWTLLCTKCQKIIPSFDCRVFQLPNETELANVFIWRELDAVRNSVQMLAQANFPHKELQGKDTKALINLLEKNDIRWNELRTDLKQGAYFHRVLVKKELDDETWNKIPENKKPESRIVTRSEIQRYELPVMKNIENKAGVYFHGEIPRDKKIYVWYIANKTMGWETRCPNCGKKHYFSEAGDTIPCRCGVRLVSKCLSSLSSLDHYHTRVNEYSLSEGECLI